jgi:hypothetical protein
MAENLEQTPNLNELITLMRGYISKIEKKFSLEALYDYLVRGGLRRPPNSRPLSIKYLEAHLAEANNSNTSPSSYHSKDPNNFNSTSRLNFANTNFNNKRVTLAQVKKIATVTSQKTELVHSARSARPVEKLIKNLAVFRKLFEIIQRDLLYDLLEFDMPSSSSTHNLAEPSSNLLISPSTIQLTTSIMMLKDESIISMSKRPAFRSLHNLSQLEPSNHRAGGSFLQDYQQIKNKSSLNGGHFHEPTRSALVKRINKNTQKILDLNEKLAILLNDLRNSDLKLLSNHSLLPTSKSETCRYGEFVMRFTLDAVYKIKFLLKLCEKNYEYFYLFFNGSQQQSVNTSATSASFILKKILRKRPSQQQQQFTNQNEPAVVASSHVNSTGNSRLPRIGSHHLNRTFMINEASSLVAEKTSETSDEVVMGGGGEDYRNEYNQSVEPTTSDVELDGNLNDNDGSDSFIQVRILNLFASTDNGHDRHYQAIVCGQALSGK